MFLTYILYLSYTAFFFFCKFKSIESTINLELKFNSLGFVQIIAFRRLYMICHPPTGNMRKRFPPFLFLMRNGNEYIRPIR